MSNTLGMAWYSPEAWQQLAAIPEARIEMSYADFVRKFAKLKRSFEAQGLTVEKVSVDVEQMIEWCHHHGYEIDEKGRTVFGAVLTMSRDIPEGLNAPFVDNTRVVQ